MAEKKCVACGKIFMGINIKLYCGCSRACLNCNGEFVINSKSPNRKYCSKECSSAALHKNKIIEKNCLNCGKKWEAIASNDQKFCSRACTPQNKKKRIIKQCRNCGKDIETIFAVDKQFCNKKCYSLSRQRPCGVRRKCTKCKETKHPNEFYTNHSWCKTCENKTANTRKLEIGSRYKRAINLARRRGLIWEISFEDYKNLLGFSCEYCQGKLPLRGTGLDRVENELGYIITNVVPCCGRCNRVKFDYFTYDEMIELGKLMKEIDARREKINVK